jgi:hypothetical protein
MSTAGVTPWHMWGSFETFSLTNGSPGLLLNQKKQLTQVRYARPESWRFFFAARLVGGVTTTPASVFCKFNLTMGLGRSTVEVNAFEQFVFSPGIGPIAAATKYSSSVNGPNRDDRVVAPFPQNVVDTLVAQDLQIQAEVQYQSGIVGNLVQVEMHAYFAPESHIRPEWFLRQFPGTENAGH